MHLKAKPQANYTLRLRKKTAGIAPAVDMTIAIVVTT